MLCSASLLLYLDMILRKTGRAGIIVASARSRMAVDDDGGWRLREWACQLGMRGGGGAKVGLAQTRPSSHRRDDALADGRSRARWRHHGRPLAANVEPIPSPNVRSSPRPPSTRRAAGARHIIYPSRYQRAQSSQASDPAQGSRRRVLCGVCGYKESAFTALRPETWNAAGVLQPLSRLPMPTSSHVRTVAGA